MGTEFQLGKMTFWRWMGLMVAQCECTLKNGYNGKCSYACFTTVKAFENLPGH